MNLTIANISTSVDDPTFAAVVSAISLQVSRDFQPLWNVTATLTGTRLDLSGPQVSVDTLTDAILYLGDSCEDPTTGVSHAYGYHFENHNKIPYGFVYLDVCARSGENWSTTLSHEVLELLADPTAVLTVTGPAPDGGADAAPVYYSLEVCDPTQGDTYTINDILVSNFVTKSYFGMDGGSSSQSTNFLNLDLEPFSARPRGYCQYADATGAHQKNGNKVDAERVAARAMLAGHRRNARRADRLTPQSTSSREAA